MVSRQDEFLVGRGLDIGITRTYNSFGETGDRDNGDNWQQSTTQRVFDLTGTLSTAGSTVKRLAADGSVVTYSWGTRDSIAAYWATDGAGSHDRLNKSGNTWLWTDGDTRTVETYDVSVGSAAEWRLIERKDADSNKLTFSYLTGTDKLDRVTAADGSWLSYVWSGTSVARIETGYTDLATSTAKTLTRTWYDYSGGRLSQVRVDLTPGDNASPSTAQSYWTQYTYDSAGRLNKIVQKDGSQVDVTYDASGRVATLTQQVATGDTRVTALTYGAGFTSVTGPDGQVTRLDYDAKKQLTKITAPPAYTGATAEVIQFGYDADGNVTTVTDAAGKITTNAYDSEGNITKITDPNGGTIERWYDTGNRVTRERIYSSSTTSPHVDQYTRYAYDSEGHLRYAIRQDGQVTEYRYTAQGQLQFSIEYPEHGYAVTADFVDEATMNTWRDAITDRSSTKILNYAYDVRGNVTAVLNYGYATATGGVATSEGYTDQHNNAPCRPCQPCRRSGYQFHLRSGREPPDRDTHRRTGAQRLGRVFGRNFCHRFLSLQRSWPGHPQDRGNRRRDQLYLRSGWPPDRGGAGKLRRSYRRHRHANGRLLLQCDGRSVPHPPARHRQRCRTHHHLWL